MVREYEENRTEYNFKSEGRGNMRRRAGFIFIIALFMLAAGAGYALAGDGNGDGSGGGQNNPLDLVSSVPANGATGVENLESIKLTFSKNVVYMTVRDNNQQCFSLWTGTERIPAEIILADDQIERDKRHDVIVKPLQPLEPGTTYRVEVAPSLESKSGVTLGTKKIISFTMAGSKLVPVPDEGQEAASVIGDLETNKTPDETPAQSPENEAAAGQDKETAAETEIGDSDKTQTGDKSQAENLEAASPEDNDQTAVEDTLPVDPNQKMKTAGLWIAVAALAVLAAGWGYRRLRK